MKNILLTGKVMSAKDNAKALKALYVQESEVWVDTCVIFQQMTDHQQYLELGYDSMLDFFAGEKLAIKKAAYYSMAATGRMMLHVSIERKQLVGIGKSCACELARLAQTNESAWENGDIIADLISRKLSGDIQDFKAFKAEVDAVLNGEGEEAKSHDWKTKYRSAMGKAKSEEEFLYMVAQYMTKKKR